MTVYNEPTNRGGALVFGIFLTLLPGLALAFFVRSRWLFAIGVALSAAVAVVVALQVAATDDAQAGLAALELPVFMGVVVVIVAVIDAGTRHRPRIEP
jgi:hypothetical protein